MDERLTIKIFATGGTIDKSMFSYETLNYEVAEPQALRILEQSNVRFKYDIESICKKDSLALTRADRELLLKRVKECAEDKIIVTHDLLSKQIVSVRSSPFVHRSRLKRQSFPFLLP